MITPTTILITNIAIPTIRQFLPNFGSSFFTAKYAIIPPIIPKMIGTIYHAFDRVFGSLTILNRLIV